MSPPPNTSLEPTSSSSGTNALAPRAAEDVRCSRLPPQLPPGFPQLLRAVKEPLGSGTPVMARRGGPQEAADVAGKSSSASMACCTEPADVTTTCGSEDADAGSKALSAGPTPFTSTSQVPSTQSTSSLAASLEFPRTTGRPQQMGMPHQHGLSRFAPRAPQHSCLEDGPACQLHAVVSAARTGSPPCTKHVATHVDGLPVHVAPTLTPGSAA